MDKLKKHVVLGALHDSSERYDPPKCHPETRVAVQRRITSWVKDNSADMSLILWLRGAAGAGKSAIAQTLSEKWSLEDLLAASFYFSRTAEKRNNSKYLATTIAYQIAQSFPHTRRYIDGVVQGDWPWESKPLKDQVLALIIRPLTAPSTTPIISAKAIVIDGLDECCFDLPHQEHEAQQREILEAISLIAEYCTPLKILIASRPERQIRESFGKKGLTGAIRIDLNDSWDPNKDIELFVGSSFDQIRRERGIEGSWPSEQVLQSLVEKSSGHFIYAAVVMRYVSNPRGDPQVRLNIVLGLSSAANTSHNPFAQLDSLYSFIMNSVLPDSLPTVKRIFQILTSPSLFRDFDPSGRLQLNTPEFFAKLLLTTKQQIYLHLIDLHSILDIPEIPQSSTHAIAFIHASFSEFLSNPNRSGGFHIDPSEACLNCALCSAMHTIVELEEAVQTRADRFYTFQSTLLHCIGLKLCPPSGELRVCLHRILKGRRVSYMQDVQDLSRTFQRNYMYPNHFCPSFTGKEQIVVLSYLQRCNTSEIEESLRRRLLTGAALLEEQIRIRSLITLFKLCYIR